jgi:hypothetical protein
MVVVFDSLWDVLPGKDTWRFSVRVARLWDVFGFRSADQVNYVEMVLINDDNVCCNLPVNEIEMNLI